MQMRLPLWWYVADGKPQRWILPSLSWLRMADVIAKVADGMTIWGWVYTEQLEDVVAMVADRMAT